MGGEWTQNMAGLKSLVAGMAVLIVVAISVLAILMVQRAGILAETPPETPIQSLSQAQTNPPEGFSLPEHILLPEGSKVLESALDGNQVFLRMGFPNGGQRLMIVEMETGNIVHVRDLKFTGPNR